MNFWEQANEKIESGQLLILMIVVKSTGSSPGKPGFKMVVSEDGKIWGSIGGGAMEYRLAEKCRKMFKEKSNKILIRKQDHHPDSEKNNSGMICSGVQWIAFYPLNNQHQNLIKQIINIQKKKLTEVVNYEESGISISKPELDCNYPVSIVKRPIWQYSEQPGIKNILYIFGAGHVSLALSKMAKDIDFEVIVFDNRKGINTFDNNTYAVEKKIIDYNNASDYIPEGNNIYVAIMTFAHQSDTTVLKQLINKKVKYIGMMGSDLKVKSIFENLQKEGFKKGKLSKINSPIGLSINSITPPEIAVSILAKIIKVKNII